MNVIDARQTKNDLFEAEILDGLRSVCERELVPLLGQQGRIISVAPDRITFEFSGDVYSLLKLRTPIAIYRLLYFKVPRPTNLVTGINLRRLISNITAIQATGSFTTFRIGAAGSDSKVFQKIRSIISQRSKLDYDETDGQMLIRFRRSVVRRFGWEVLIRLTPLPLSVRSWRVENMPGALNATIAAAIILSMDPKPEDIFLNLMCGSGTLLAERAAICSAIKLTGIDVSDAALEKARKNLSALSVTLLHEDATNSSLADGSVNSICVDLPWGRLIGEKRGLEELYSKSLDEMTRVCAVGGRAAILTQENRIFEMSLDKLKSSWKLITSFRVQQSGYKPKIYLLKRTEKAYRPPH